MNGWLLPHHERGQQILKNSQKIMLDYLISLLDDANDFSRVVAKAGHTVLLCHMEHGEIASYQEIDKIDRVRRANAQRHVTVNQTNVQNLAHKKFLSKTTKSMPCQYYKQGSCVHSKSHDTKVPYTSIFVHHVLLPMAKRMQKMSKHGCGYSNPYTWHPEYISLL